MGAMFRSEEMALCQLFIQPEAAYTSVSELGEAGTVQFRDLNPDVNAFQRKFVNEVRRCDEMERKLRYIEAELNKDGVHIPDVKEQPRAPNPREIIDLEAHLEKTENEIQELSHNAVNLKQNYLELTELRHVLEKTEAFFLAQEESGMDSLTKSLISDETGQQAATRGRLGFVAGVVQRERVPAFERMLWRISRGNVFLRRAELDKPLEDPNTGNEIYKTVFVAFFQGEQLKSRIKKVCTGFHASLYPCPPSNVERQDMVKGVRTRLEDLNMVLNQTRDHRQRVLASVAKELASWSVMVRKMKAIYHTLNLFNMDVTKKCLIGECWVPTADLPNVQKALQDGSNACGSSIPSFLNCIETSEEPPTFNRTNRFTRGFQTLIDAYGVASYRECNPALYTIITFPFLFAVMFGDLGHGAIMAAFGAWMVMKEVSLAAKKSNNEIWNIFFAGRYIILLMGCFSMYTGLVYNDIFSKSMNIFGTSWRIPYDNETMEHNSALTLDPKTSYSNEPYFIGIDPIWQSADNKIIFLNSYKMKLSIIFGVVHMIFGVCMSVVNFNFFKRRYSIFLEFLPQVIFLCLLFLYMVFMMFFKWLNYSTFSEDEAYKQGCAPSVLILFINMMLFSSNEPEPGCKEFMFDSQGTVQRAFVLVALCCIPVMLLGKPLYLLSTMKKKAKHDDKNACGSSIPSFLNCIETSEEPPTFNRTNRFTRGFQTLIDAYGVASYRECNPALYTIITFPFLFAVMFGDLGHGAIMAAFGAWMVMKEVSLAAKKSNNEIWNIFFAGRYIILLMGCFSMYTGLVYNDIFSKSMNIFGTSWRIPYDNETMEHNSALTLDPKTSYSNEPYFIGIDPIWQSADNKIIFLNSYKMKLSIIFGVVHMIFGVCMSVVNFNFFKRRYSIFLEFLPQVIFLCLLFLYMVFMMFFKWLNYSTFSEDEAYKQGCAPSVLILFINMMLFSSNEPEPGCKEFMFDSQGTVQRAFVLVALCCIPVMLLGKPLYLLSTMKKKAKHDDKPVEQANGGVTAIELQEQTDLGENGNGQQTPVPAKSEPKPDSHEDEPFSEIMIHQAIHTIEYVLSTISHTASYLRLWALSLAHAELSEVLWNMVLQFGLTTDNYIGAIKLYVAFCFWALFTLAILVMMEGLSAFLHTLRLHWVEFMSKFYSGLGYVFQPFSFKSILEQEDGKDD